MPKLRSPQHLLALWRERLSGGALQFDAAQEEALGILQRFADQLNQEQGPRSLIRRFLSPAPKGGGFYLYGDVGRGKTMLMDLFFGEVEAVKKRRVHFHQFMLEAHEKLAKFQKAGESDVLARLADDIAANARLLCFDEFHVSNIADAMILGRLFEELFERGVFICLTSNWPPDDLYHGGLQRERFLPFIDLIKQRMTLYHLRGAIDHRFEKTRTLPICFTPLSDDATRHLQGLFLQLTDEAEPQAVTLPVQGRVLNIVHAAKGVGYFNFDELCGRPMGAADFLAIAKCLHTVLLDGVPVMQKEKRDETLRFMTLIDALYEAHTKLFMAAAAAPEKLAPDGEHAFAFQRTVSRLAEMSGEEYRQNRHLA